MDLALILKAVILGLVEGFTEFLPISSTGHLILAGELLGFNDERGKLFAVVIQSGALLALCWEYRQRILSIAMGEGIKAGTVVAMLATLGVGVASVTSDDRGGSAVRHSERSLES